MTWSKFLEDPSQSTLSLSFIGLEASHLIGEFGFGLTSQFLLGQHFFKDLSRSTISLTFLGLSAFHPIEDNGFGLLPNFNLINNFLGSFFIQVRYSILNLIHDFD